MASLKNSYNENIYGDGHRKTLEIDDGARYEIRNTPMRNIYGDGYVQEIVKTQPVDAPTGFILAGFAALALFLAIMAGKVSAIIISAAVAIIFFLMGIASESRKWEMSFGDTLTAYLLIIGAFILVVAGVIGAGAFMIWCFTSIMS